jgi:hypothetical protein
MNVTEAIELVGRWPQDRTVPSKLSKAVQAAKGVERQQLGMMFEALVAASETAEDFELIGKYTR